MPKNTEIEAVVLPTKGSFFLVVKVGNDEFPILAGDPAISVNKKLVEDAVKELGLNIPVVAVNHAVEVQVVYL